MMLKMEYLNNQFTVFLLLISILAAFLVFSIAICSAQLGPNYTFFYPFGLQFNPYIPFIPTIPPVIPGLKPILTPYTAGLPTLGRFANATIIIITSPLVNPVTAYAPLGTVTLTPSVLVPLNLFLTLAE